MVRLELKLSTNNTLKLSPNVYSCEFQKLNHGYGVQYLKIYYNFKTIEAKHVTRLYMPHKGDKMYRSKLICPTRTYNV
jgi:hypothetical protein